MLKDKDLDDPLDDVFEFDPRGAPDLGSGSSPILIKKTCFTLAGNTTSIYACGPLRATLSEGMADVVSFARIDELQQDRDAAVADHEQGLEIQSELSSALAVLLHEQAPEPCSPGCRTPHLSEAASARVDQALCAWIEVVAQRHSAQAALKEHESERNSLYTEVNRTRQERDVARDALNDSARKLQEAARLMGKAERLQAVVDRLLDGMTPYPSALEMDHHIDGNSLADELWAAAGREGKWRQPGASEGSPAAHRQAPSGSAVPEREWPPGLWLAGDRFLAAIVAIRRGEVDSTRAWIAQAFGPGDVAAFDQAVTIAEAAQKETAALSKPRDEAAAAAHALEEGEMTHEWAFEASPEDDPYEPAYPSGKVVLTTKTTGTPEHPDGCISYDEPDIESGAVRMQRIWPVFGSEILRLSERVRELEAELAQRGCVMTPFDRIAADRLADEVAVLVTRGHLDSRSAAADALLDYREPPRTERSDRLASLEEQVRQFVAYSKENRSENSP